MKWTFPALIIGIISLIGLMSYWLFFQTAAVNPNETLTDPFATNPSEGNGATGIRTPLQNQVAAKVTERVKNTVTPEPTTGVGSDFYYLATSTDYTIYYYAPDQSVQVSLNTEPIGRARKEAEKSLLSKLKITENEACALNYQVATPRSVDEKYNGKNLGFSFCPGSIFLPEI